MNVLKNAPNIRPVLFYSLLCAIFASECTGAVGAALAGCDTTDD